MFFCLFVCFYTTVVVVRLTQFVGKCLMLWVRVKSKDVKDVKAVKGLARKDYSEALAFIRRDMHRKHNLTKS